jgi:hypothetical protein
MIVIRRNSLAVEIGSRDNLANAYWEAGRADEAIPLNQCALGDKMRILGPDHRETLASRRNLANAYLSVGRVGEAISLLERTLVDFQ